jgi:hypothetical protein
MKGIQLYILVASLLGATLGSAIARAADLNGTLPPRHVSVSVHSVHRGAVVPAGCGWRCRGGCPDRYSCYPLYGAYGPYGGTAYWARYTISGWGYFR